MKTEILNDIKKTESEDQSMINTGAGRKKEETCPGRAGKAII